MSCSILSTSTSCTYITLQNMIIPIRCFSCGKVIGNKWEAYLGLLQVSTASICFLQFKIATCVSSLWVEGLIFVQKKSETVYPPIWGILKLSVLLNQKILNGLSKFSNLSGFWNRLSSKGQTNCFLFTPELVSELVTTITSDATHLERLVPL